MWVGSLGWCMHKVCEISSCMKTFFDSMYELSSCCDRRDNVISYHVWAISWPLAQTILLHTVIWFQMRWLGGTRDVNSAKFWKQVLCIILIIQHLNHIRIIFGYKTLESIKMGLTWGRRRWLRWTWRCRCWCCLGSPCCASGWPGSSSPPGISCC